MRILNRHCGRNAAILIALLFLPVAPARAETLCSTAYHDAAQDYWRIVSDMTQYRALFDNYDKLCQQYYPAEIEKLQPEADLLRATIARDMNDAPRVITEIFSNQLPQAVSPQCAAEKITRATALRNFLKGMAARDKSLNARMNKSAKTLRDPAADLKLCRDLPALAPKIRKALGPGLSTPLLTMSELNSRFMVGDSGKMKKAFTAYRETLQSLPSEGKKPEN